MATKADAISAAKQPEIDGRRFYLAAAAKAAAETPGAMFRALAADEERLLGWIAKLAPDALSSEEANRALYAKLRGVFADASAAEAAVGPAGDIAAIDVAIGMEEKSLDAYTEWAEDGETEDIRKLGKVLAGQERFHRQLLENAKEYLGRPGDWFMQEERWNFEGG